MLMRRKDFRALNKSLLVQLIAAAIVPFKEMFVQIVLKIDQRNGVPLTFFDFRAESQAAIGPENKGRPPNSRITDKFRRKKLNLFL